MGVPHWADHLEVKPLKLTAEHIPLARSLLEPVIKRYAEPQDQAMSMGVDELLGYLRNTEDLNLTPLQSILAQTEAIGDPALPSVDQCAILRWLGNAFDEWERQYPLDSTLCQQLRRLKPLAASLAAADPEFMVPGDHPLHRILDSLQLGAVGWQASLGRAGQSLQKQIGNAVEDALAWFDDNGIDLEAVCSRVVEIIERDQARANRMARRMIETEQGRAKTTEARQLAAEVINAALTEFQAPNIVGEFLKGPWYDSAQLVLLKFGVESAQWTQMSATTLTLLDSVQFTSGDADLEVEGDPERRQRLFELVSQLPRDLKRWLIGLQHDNDAIEDAMGMVEYAHMQILRKQPLELEKIALIPVPTTGKVNAEEQELAPINTGQWFSVDLGDDEHKRMKLVLRTEQPQELLFANLAGVKVLQASFAEFAALMNDGKVSALESGASFSLSLAHSAGIDSVEELDTSMGSELQQAWSETQRLTQQQQETELVEEAVPGPDVAEHENPATVAEPAVLATGAWLGFHDGEAPLLAKLAVHDRKNNSYTFVNRSGIKMRQLSREELLDLIDRNLVDILETRSSFRDEISRAKQKSQE